MRHRLSTAPWWVLGLIMGVFFGVFMAVFTRLNDSGTDGGGAAGFVIQSVISGVPFGLGMGWLVKRANRRAMKAAGTDDVSEMFAVSRAANRGPVPTDPRLRTAALNLARHRLDEYRRKRTFTLLVFGLGTLGYIAGAILASPWWALGAVLFLGLLAQSLLLPARLERRIDLLADTPSEVHRPPVSP